MIDSHDENTVDDSISEWVARGWRSYRCVTVGCCYVIQNIGMNMLTSRVHDAWCLDVADRHRGHVVMMKMNVELRQTTRVLS